MKGLIIIAISLSIIFACQNYCNGHGECEANDKCNCFPGWGGAECNLRSCPYSDAFIDLLPGDLDHDGTVTTDDTNANNYHAVKNEWNPAYGTSESVGELIKETKRAHRYAECSNAGICNRENGLCVCYNGFEGSACQRRSCPASSDGLPCSGHGICLSSEASIIKNTPASGTAAIPSGWEYQKFGVCECDKGWTGISCGSRICPKGLDPVKVGKVEYKFSFKSTSNGGAFASGNNAVNTNKHYYEMTYDGVTYKTPIIPARTAVCASGKMTNSGIEAAEDIRRALVSIPPLSQSKVTITCSSDSKISSIDISTPYIELDLSTSSGTCSSGSSCSIGIGGTTPTPYDSKITLFQAVDVDQSSSNKDAITSITLTPSSSSFSIEKDSFISCSGRGICNAGTGLCDCFDNYSGVACERTRN